MTDSVAAPGERKGSFPFARVHKCRIHPGIGIARVGNSQEFFIGPEAPRDPVSITGPEGSFKDADGRIKRQGARFRIYAYDKDDNVLGELPLGSEGDRKNKVAAQVEWKVHLANKKGAWYRVYSRFEQHPVKVRNADVPVPAGKAPDSRVDLVIDPGERAIDGEGNSIGQQRTAFDTGTFRGTKVPLGELRVDPQGRLIVIGGAGHSASVKPDNPIGNDPTDPDYWADNDFWYDDMSDGPVKATVVLPDGTKLPIDQPQDAAWVIVAPPKYAPAIYPIVTLYDVMREVALDNGWIKDDGTVLYWRDIYPTLRRAADTAWVNDEAKRGHGFDKRGSFTADPGTAAAIALASSGAIAPAAREPRTRVTAALLLSDKLMTQDGAKERERIFRRIRNPRASGDDAVKEATFGYMPPLSGDGGDRAPGDPTTWLSIPKSQYAKFERWKNGQFTPGCRPNYPALEEIPPALQPEALQRAALEPCVGGPLYPGIEAPWIVLDADLYAGTAFRIGGKWKPGDITKFMCLPWQADFYECRETWWPSARPDDVVPEEVFLEANSAWVAGQPELSEALEGRVKWERGLGVTTLFRRPWKNPADAFDDPRDRDRRGCDDMVRYWNELGFVTPRMTAWRDPASPAAVEYVHVETERRPHAGMDVRELFHCLVNLDKDMSCLPKVEEFVCSVLAAARELQKSASAFAWMDNIRPFLFDDDVFDARMKDIYDDCADFALTEKIDGVRVPYNPANPEHNPYFRARENVIERIRQLTPFNFLDGSWLRNIHRTGPVDEVNAILFTILKEELGDGVVSQNHANIYQELCHSFGFYPPPMDSLAFAYDPSFLDCAFDSPAFQLGISQFSRRFYPEIIGMSLWLEWTVMELHRIASIVENVGLSSHFYRMHIAIDNAASGHGAMIKRAVKIYLQNVLAEGGPTAVKQHWERIWDGYVAFAYTFVIVIRQVIRSIQKPLSLEERLKRLIIEKAPFGQYNHGRRKLGNLSINALFSNPEEFLKALCRHGYLIPGRPDESPFFKLLEFRGGRMYHVFTEAEVQLWRDWTLTLGQDGGGSESDAVPALRERLAVVDSKFADDLRDPQLSAWLGGAAPHRIVLWLEIALSALRGKSESTLTARKRHDAIVALINERYGTWLTWSMIRAVTYIAAQYRESVEDVVLKLPDPESREQLTIAKWFERIVAAPNSAVPVYDFLKSLAARPNIDAFVTELFAQGTPLAYALDSGVPGNDGRTARETLKAWMSASRPQLQERPSGKVKALRLDSSLNEEERHPTGIIMGFGTVH